MGRLVLARFYITQSSLHWIYEKGINQDVIKSFQEKLTEMDYAKIILFKVQKHILNCLVEEMYLSHRNKDLECESQLLIEHTTAVRCSCSLGIIEAAFC